MTDWDAELDALLDEMEGLLAREALLAERWTDEAFRERLRGYMERYRVVLERLAEE